MPLWILSWATRVSQNQKEHSPTHTYHGHQSSLICFLHLLWSMASCLFNLRAWQSFFHNFSPSFLWFTSWPGTLNFILHTFLHPIIVFFCNTCPYHRTKYAGLHTRWLGWLAYPVALLTDNVNVLITLCFVFSCCFMYILAALGSQLVDCCLGSCYHNNTLIVAMAAEIYVGIVSLKWKGISYRWSLSCICVIWRKFVVLLLQCLQCFDTVGWVSARASGL